MTSAVFNLLPMVLVWGVRLILLQYLGAYMSVTLLQLPLFVKHAVSTLTCNARKLLELIRPASKKQNYFNYPTMTPFKITDSISREK